MVVGEDAGPPPYQSGGPQNDPEKRLKSKEEGPELGEGSGISLEEASDST